MGSPYIAEIRTFGFNFAPLDWAQCNGQLIDISQNSALFQILGTTYGGNGTTNFALPNLQDLVPVNQGQGIGLRNWPLGGTFGEQSHTLLINEVPLHNHTMTASRGPTNIETANPGSTSLPGEISRIGAYASTANSVLAGASIGPSGGSLPHPNIMPVLVLNYCISLFGVFPPHS
jgi:microcystin-dependent protein